MNCRIWLMALFSGVLALTGGVAMAETKTVSGTVTYLNRSMLPPGAELDVRLVDVSRADAPSVLLSAQRYGIKRVPFPFTLPYDASLIDERMSYAVQASISVDGQVIYRSTSVNSVLTRNGTDSVDIIVDLMPAAAASTDPGLEGSNWQVFELGGRMLITDKRPSINFLPEGRVSMRGGCNGFNGEVEISGSSLSFSDRMAGTLRACVPPLDQLEQDFLKALGTVSGFVRSGDNLALVNSNGVTVMRLSRVQ